MADLSGQQLDWIGRGSSHGNVDPKAGTPERPRTRGECVDAPRPCPWVGCRYHLALEVSSTGALRLAFPRLEPWELAETCSLDIADRGPLSLEQIGSHLGVSREGARRTERRAMRILRVRRGRLR